MRRRLSKIVPQFSVFLIVLSCSSEQTVELGQQKGTKSFAALLDQVASSDSLDQFSLVDEFLDSVDFPWIENDSTVFFLYQGDASSVAIAGDFTGWSPGRHDFDRLRDTDLWYRKENFESNARLDYKLVINGTNWVLDPRNPNRIAGGFGANSELAMPGYVQPWEVVSRETVPKGRLERMQISSTSTGSSYAVTVYLPANYDEQQQYPAAYFQDGGEYLSLASASTVMDNLIHDGQIAPCIGIFVTPNDRGLEYAFGDRFKYRDFFSNELVKAIDSLYATDSRPEGRAVIGDSYGGNISAIIAFSRPDIFGNCGIHSGAFQPNNFSTNRLVMDGLKKNIRVASVWGTYEGSSLPPNMRAVRDYLQSEGYDLFWKELPEGHSWGLWRATIDDMLLFFFPAD